mmetsp:Transcript_8576/g.15084  ORF Transcript_8576/g.15084 Transcript_8576/m.15084 type:complete len:252 (+) Transcript_8576:107-862(+)
MGFRDSLKRLSGKERSGNNSPAKAGSLMSRIAAFEQAAAEANDPEVMAAKISEFSDRKKYNFADGLKRDLEHTRAALRACAGDGKSCTFGALFEFTEGKIANLNRILQNLKNANEVAFQVEVFFAGPHANEPITLLDAFWDQDYTVDAENVFRPGRNFKDVEEKDRKGRSYVSENQESRGQRECTACGELVAENSRLVLRGRVFHMQCVECVVCGAHPRSKADFVTFDGEVACSSECIKLYDAAHPNQARS